MKVTIGISNHHVHVTEEDFLKLFGSDASLTKFKDINQPGQYACEERVDIKSDKGILKGLRILGPFRSYTQVELSQTDCRSLKIEAPVRLSGELENAGVVTIVGPCGEITKSAAIIADRHIHVTREDAERLNLVGVNEVTVRVDNPKGGEFYHVKVRESDASFYEMHIDTDDANAFMIDNGQEGEIII